MTRKRTLASLLAGAAATITLALPAAASAAPTCTYLSTSHSVRIAFSSPELVELSVSALGTIGGRDGNNNPLGCGKARVTNTDSITVTDNSTAGNSTVRIEDPAAFAPGFSGAGGDDGHFAKREIEINLSLGAGSDFVGLQGASAADNFTVGTLGINPGAMGINPNGAEPRFTPGPDADIVTSGVETLQLSGGAGNDRISGQGAVAGDTPATIPLILNGEPGDDTLVGGNGPDYLSGERGTANQNDPSGADVLEGAGGDDDLDGGGGNDAMSGGPGIDVADYLASPAGVDVDLAVTGQQDTGDGIDTLSALENVAGSAYDDVLAGDGGPNELHGYRGTDTVSYLGAASGVNVDLGIQAPQDTGGAGTDRLLEVDNLIGSLFGDVLVGNADANLLNGRAGDDEVTGAGGADVLRGSADIDLLDADDGTADTEIDCGGGDNDLEDAVVDAADPAPISC